MSEYHAVKTAYKDPEVLIEALTELKVGAGDVEVEFHEVAQPLLDFRGRQTHYVSSTGDVANIIVRRKYVKGMSNDLGFVRTADGTFTALISEYDSGLGCTPEWQLALKKLVGEKALLKTAKKMGLKYIGTTVVNGKKQIKWLDQRA
jgi:hypothetical protein